jgi:propanediol utilization protein
METLFGKGAKLELLRPLSQPGQYLSTQRVALVGEKNTFENVGIIGPERKESQIEISRTDTFALGVKNVPIRQSGILDAAPTMIVRVGENTVRAKVIVAKRHVHLTPETAAKFGIKDGQNVRIKTVGERAAILDAVVARVSPTFADAVHLDSDESNAILPAEKVEILFD